MSKNVVLMMLAYVLIVLLLLFFFWKHNQSMTRRHEVRSFHDFLQYVAAPSGLIHPKRPRRVRV